MAAMDQVEFAAAKENRNRAHVQKLRDIAATCGYQIAYKGTVTRRGWPERSEKPWSIRYGDDTLCAAFATLDKLERNLRGRCGC